MDIQLNQIKPGRFQPRQKFEVESMLELAQAIQDNGLIYPVVAFKNEAGEYELLGGERRWRASCALALAEHLSINLAEGVQQVCQANWPLAGVKEWQIPLSHKSIRVEVHNGGAEECHLISVVDNFQRQDLSPLEEGWALAQLKERYNYSVRQLAAKVGKSKSWVDDRLTMADRLNPALNNSLINPAPGPAKTNTELPAPVLDLAILREIARKIPQDYQAPLAEKLKKAVAEGKNNQALITLITNVARLVDTSRYKLDRAIPYPPHVRNRARLMAHLLDLTPPKQVIDTVCQMERLTTQMAALLEHAWNFYPLANSLLTGQPCPTDTSDAAWSQLAPGQGWTCDNCALRNLTAALATRSETLDYHMPCRQIKTTRLNPDNPDVPPLRTCDSFINAEADPLVIVTPKILWTYLDFSRHSGIIRGQEVADQEYFTDNVADFIELYHLAVAAQQQEQTAQATQYLEAMRRYWQAQQTGNFNLDHFYACACRKCRHFTSSADVPCRFALEPLKNGDHPRAPYYGVWQPATGQPLPRCEQFEYSLEWLAVQKPLLFGAHIPDRALVTGWFAHVLAKDEWKLNSTHLYHILGWLGVRTADDLLAVWHAIGNDDVMLSVLHTAITEMLAIDAFRYGDSTISVTSPLGQRATFTFRNF